MSFSLAPLLIHSPDLPTAVRDELRAAYAKSPGQRDGHLMTAARIIHTELELECRDARELVGLPTGDC
jgi:hypothetical protein